MRHLVESEERILNTFLNPLNEPPSSLPDDVAESIRSIPVDFKSAFLPEISFLKEEHDRYQSVLSSFDEVYENYNEKLSGKKVSKVKKDKFAAIIKDWSKKIENAFPLLKEMIEMLIDQTKTLATKELSDLPVIKKYMHRYTTVGKYRTDNYLKGLIRRCEGVADRFQKEFAELKAKLPENVPEEPRIKEFLNILKKEFGSLSKFSCLCA